MEICGYGGYRWLSMTMDSYKRLWRAIDHYGCCGWLWVVMDIVDG